MKLTSRQILMVLYISENRCNYMGYYEMTQKAKYHSDVDWQHCPCPVIVSFLSGFSGKACLVSVRIFRKNTVCLSGRTTMRQSFMDFCCPCPPKSGIYDDQNSWNYQKYKNRLYFPNRMYVLFLLDIHHCDSDLNGILKYSYSGWIPSYLMRYLFTFWFSIWNNFNFKQAKKLDFDWWMSRRSDRLGELRLRARRFDWTYDL